MSVWRKSVNNQSVKTALVLFFIIGTVGIVALAGLGLSNTNATNERDFLRFHIMANSNNPEDQAVKYIVKQHVVNELTPIFYNITSRQDAMFRVKQNLSLIENITNSVLKSNGFNYTSSATIQSNLFPTRSYTVSGVNMVLPAGEYDALIVTLGSGHGDNWWCVIYPPLCFLQNNIGGSDGIRYRSRILSWFR